MRKAALAIASVIAIVACGDLVTTATSEGDAGGPDGSVPSAADGGALDAGGPSCPAKMVLVSGGAKPFCIDATEVTVADWNVFVASKAGAALQPPACAGNTNFGPNCATQSTDAGAPVNCVDWCDAYAYCKWAKKRLCGRISGGSLTPDEVAGRSPEDQWFAACSAAGARAYAYGDTAQAGACVSSVTNDAGPSLAGSTPTCEGGYPGLFDMSGNVAEWQDACDDDAGKCYVRGGSFEETPDNQPCARAEPKTRTTGRGPEIGVRCCADL